MSMLVIFKSVCRRGALPAALAALLAAVLLCGSLGGNAELPRCGVTGGGADAGAVLLRDALIGDGMILCENEDALRAAMQSGEISMGVVLPDDLTARLAARDTRGVLRFLDTPTTVFAPLWRLRVTARLTELYAPYMASGALADAGVERTSADMRAAIDTYLAADAPFRFTYETAAGTPVAAEGLGIRAVRGCLALLLFCLFGFFACPFDGESLRRLSGRLGAKTAFFRLILPGVCAVLLLTAAATAAALALCDVCFGTGAMALLGTALCYAVFLSGFGLLVSLLIRDAAGRALLLSVLALLSVAFCPIFFDLPALLGFAWVRFLLPPSFFAFAESGGALPPAAALAVWLGALALYAFRLRRPYKS